MSIPDGLKKINIVVLLAIIMVLGFFLAFGGLKLSSILDQKQPIRVVSASTIAETTEFSESTIKSEFSQEKRVVASKTGSKFHLLDCPGAKQISEKNKVYFESPALALKAGLSPAANCRGLSKP